MKNLFNTSQKALADAALLELGVLPADSESRGAKARETIENNLVEIAFAEAADYEQIHKALSRERMQAEITGRVGDCLRDDHGLCAA